MKYRIGSRVAVTFSNGTIKEGTITAIVLDYFPYVYRVNVILLGKEEEVYCREEDIEAL